MHVCLCVGLMSPFSCLVGKLVAAAGMSWEDCRYFFSCCSPIENQPPPLCSSSVVFATDILDTDLWHSMTSILFVVVPALLNSKLYYCYSCLRL